MCEERIAEVVSLLGTALPKGIRDALPYARSLLPFIEVATGFDKVKT